MFDSSCSQYQLYSSEMNQEFRRTDRVAQLIQRRLAEIIQTELKDPRLPRFITVSAVVVSKDLAYAKVYVSILGESCNQEEVLSILNGANAFLRTALARTIKLRVVPQLQFVYDGSIEYGNRLSQLIDSVIDDNDDEPDDLNTH